uniref:taxadiene 5-alpha hydroxylase-like n=1 Tax=Erigeron canadensis TaxID=72917 RepID=UPI001CB981A5|nr:taxadiene 5-alpha hydroxylase-like [Erigeron canadensis]
MELEFYTTLSFVLLFFLTIFFILKEKNNNPRLPPGSLGLPWLGSSYSFHKAITSDRIQEWFQKGIKKYGPIWKTNIFGYQTVLLHGISANKFVLSYDANKLSAEQPPSFTMIMGRRVISELKGDDHKRVKGAILSFLKADLLKQYVSKVDEEIQYHFKTHWDGKQEIQVQSLMKMLTFDIICALLFGIERGPKRDRLLPPFEQMTKALFAPPINLPFTSLNRGIMARKKLVPMILDIIHEKRETLGKQNQQPNFHNDLITHMVSLRGDNSSLALSDEEITDNIIATMLAGHDSTSSLLSMLIKLLANNKSIYSKILKEHEEISKSKSYGEVLTWEDLKKMKYTWCVASEMLRMYPPGPVSFRRVVQDIEYEGYIIPKGWQVLVCPINTHMNNETFHNPTVFDPTRFEKDAPSPPPFSLVPFGAGPRICPGYELAKMETLAVIHHLVRKFTLDLVNKDESFKRLPIPVFDHGLLARIKPI